MSPYTMLFIFEKKISNIGKISTKWSLTCIISVFSVYAFWNWQEDFLDEMIIPKKEIMTLKMMRKWFHAIADHQANKWKKGKTWKCRQLKDYLEIRNSNNLENCNYERNTLIQSGNRKSFHHLVVQTTKFYWNPIKQMDGHYKYNINQTICLNCNIGP